MRFGLDTLKDRLDQVGVERVHGLVNRSVRQPEMVLELVEASVAAGAQDELASGWASVDRADEMGG